MVNGKTIIETHSQFSDVWDIGLKYFYQENLNCQCKVFYGKVSQPTVQQFLLKFQ